MFKRSKQHVEKWHEWNILKNTQKFHEVDEFQKAIQYQRFNNLFQKNISEILGGFVCFQQIYGCEITLKNVFQYFFV